VLRARTRAPWPKTLQAPARLAASATTCRPARPRGAENVLPRLVRELERKRPAGHRHQGLLACAGGCSRKNPRPQQGLLLHEPHVYCLPRARRTSSLSSAPGLARVGKPHGVIVARSVGAQHLRRSHRRARTPGGTRSPAIDRTRPRRPRHRGRAYGARAAHPLHPSPTPPLRQTPGQTTLRRRAA